MTPRIHVDEPIAGGAVRDLSERASRHLQVLRLQPGAAVHLFDGAGAEWHATVVRIGRRVVEVRVGERLADAGCELARRVTLAIGVPANERMDALVEKATELGVAAIRPLLCERSVLRLAGERAAAKQRHWSAVAAAASEQCGRRVVPEVAVQVPLARWLDELAAEPAPGRWLLSLDARAEPPAARLAALAADAPLVVLSGPEGGLGAAEEAAAVERGFVRIGLGPRVLRADTAPLALLAWIGLAAG